MPGERVMVVEDEAIVALDIRQRLERMGYQVPATASTLEEALRRAAQARPEVVLMDIMLKGRPDGLEAAAQLALKHDVPVVFLTAHADLSTVRQASAREPYGYVVKPFDDKDLRVAIEVAVHRHRTDRKLRRAERWLASTLRSIGDGVLVTDRDGVVTYLNPVAERITGWPAAEARGRRLEEVFAVLTPDRRRLEGLAQRVLREGLVVEMEAGHVLVARGGGAVRIDDSAAPIDEGGPESSGVVIVFRESGGETGARAEARARAERLEAVGRLASGVAHDFNNMLTAILGYSEMLQQSLPPESPAQGDVLEIEKAARRAAETARALLSFSRPQLGEARAVDLNAMVLDVRDMLSRLLGERVTLSLEPAQELWSVRADSGQLVQVLTNLILNARDAMPEGGTVAVKTENLPRGVPGLPPGSRAAAGRWVGLSVSDTGEGMSQETLARLFEPFFTTKAKGKGTGMGLASAYAVVRRAGGEITVESGPGRGSLFRILLPAASGAPEPSAERPAQAPSGGRESILLVEDEPALRRMTQRILEGQGYRVTPAEGAEEALRHLEGDGAADLLLSDIVLPGMPGRELVEAALRMRAGLKVLLMSGYTEEDPSRYLAEETGFPFLPKPFDPPLLARRVREILDA